MLLNRLFIRTVRCSNDYIEYNHSMTKVREQQSSQDNNSQTLHEQIVRLINTTVNAAAVIANAA
jgi:hypothetical protein